MKKLLFALCVVLGLSSNAFAEEHFHVIGVVEYGVLHVLSEDGKILKLIIENMPAENVIRRELWARMIGKDIRVNQRGVAYIETKTIEEYLKK